MKNKFFAKLATTVVTRKYFFIFSLFFLISFIFFQSTFWYQDQNFYIKSKLWSDFAAHLSLIRSFSFGANFNPIQYPMFAGPKITYHFLFYLLVGLLELIGLRIDLALNLLSAFGSALLLTMLIKLGDFYFNFKTGLLAVILFLFNGSLTFLIFLQKNNFSSFSQFINHLVNLKNFVSFGPWDGGVISAFWSLNIFTNQRHLALGLGVLLYLIYFVEQKLAQEKLDFSFKELLLVMPLVIVLPILHQASFAFLLTYLVVSWLKNFKKINVKNFILIFIIGLNALAVYWHWSSSYLPIFQPGFLAKQVSFYGLLNYWFLNIGLYLFFAPFILLLIIFRQKELTKVTNLYLSGLLVFILANLFKFSPDMINNHKFITIFLLILNLIVASLLVKLFSAKKWWKKIGAVIVLCLLTFSGLVDLFPILNDSLVVKKDYQQTEFGRWVAETDRNSVFLVNSYLYNPVSLAGRKLYLDYGYFAWSMGYPDRDRRKVQEEIFAATISRENWCQLMTKENIDYIALDTGEKKFFAEYAVTNAALVSFTQPQTFISNGIQIQLYNIKDICQNQ